MIGDGSVLVPSDEPESLLLLASAPTPNGIDFVSRDFGSAVDWVLRC
jgi:hypothetical protein